MVRRHGEDEFHTLAIDEGTHRWVGCEPYELLFEAPEAEPSP
jgi:hypothetical protein